MALLISNLKLVSYERALMYHEYAYVYVEGYTIDAEEGIEQGAEIYIICLDEDGYFDAVYQIDTNLCVFNRIPLTDQQIEDNEGLKEAIQETGAKML